MAVTIKKRSKPSRKATLTPAVARERYRELVEAAAADGVEHTDLAALQPVCFALKKTIDDFHADVDRLDRRREAAERLKAATAMQADIEKLRQRVRDTNYKLDSLRTEFYAAELPLVQQWEHENAMLKGMLDEQREEREDAIRVLRDTADPEIMQQIETVRKQQTRVRDALNTLPRELARAEHHDRVVRKLQEQFEAWRKGKPVGLASDASGLVKLPLWHDDAGSWGQLVKPTPAAVAECQARLERFVQSCQSPQQVRDRMAECQQAIARYEQQIEELHVAMLR